MLVFSAPFPLSFLRADSTKMKADSTQPVVDFPQGVRATFAAMNDRIGAAAAARGVQS